MPLKTTAGAWLAGLALWLPCAHADVVRFAFEGRITYDCNMGAAGTPVTGSFSWDTAQPPGGKDDPRAAPTAIYDVQYYFPQGPHTLKIKVGDHVVETGSLMVRVANDEAGADYVDVRGYTPVVDGTRYPDGSLGITLATRYGNTEVLQSSRLPRLLDLDRFDATSPQAGSLRSDGSGSGMVLWFQVDTIRVAAEPTAPPVPAAAPAH